MSFSVTADGSSCECSISDEDISFTSESTTVKIKTEDIIGCEVVPPYFFFRQYALYLWYIKEEERKLTKASIHISGEVNVCEKLSKDVEENLKKLSKRPKSLLVLINPIGGNKTALKDHKNIVEPVLKLAGIKCDVIVSKRPKHMRDTITDYDIKEIDGVVVLGGDGSFSDVASALLKREQKKASIDGNDPKAKIPVSSLPVGLVPSGSGNAVAGRATGFKDVLNSTLHIIKGNIYHMNMIGAYADNNLLNYTGIASSHGSFTDFIYHTDNTYRWLGRLRYYVVPIWLGFVRPFIRSINAEVTFFGDVTETEKSKEQKPGEIEVMLEGKKVTGVQSYTKDSVVIEGKYSSITTINGNVFDAINQKYVWNKVTGVPGNVFSTFLYHEDMTELQLFQHMKEILQQADERNISFIDIMNCRGLQVRVKDSGDGDGSVINMLRHLVLTDGEMHNIKDLDIQFWLHEKIIPLYTSYLQD